MTSSHMYRQSLCPPYLSDSFNYILARREGKDKTNDEKENGVAKERKKTSPDKNDVNQRRNHNRQMPPDGATNHEMSRFQHISYTFFTI